jgi:putative transposase
VRGKKVRTTVPDPDGARAPDLVKRQSTAGAPNRLWVADFTYVSTWAGTVYTAFAIDAFSRKIVGWKTSMSKETSLVLDTIEMGLHGRDYRAQDGETKLVHHSDAGSQYTSFRFTQHLIDSGVDASIGTVGDALDNALAESLIGLYKTELINHAGHGILSKKSTSPPQHGWIGTTTVDYTEPAKADHRLSSRPCTSWAT